MKLSDNEIENKLKDQEKYCEKDSKSGFILRNGKYFSVGFGNHNRILSNILKCKIEDCEEYFTTYSIVRTTGKSSLVGDFPTGYTKRQVNKFVDLIIYHLNDKQYEQFVGVFHSNKDEENKIKRFIERIIKQQLS